MGEGARNRATDVLRRRVSGGAKMKELNMNSPEEEDEPRASDDFDDVSR